MSNAGRIYHTGFESGVLKNNPLGDSPVRHLYVYLPPSYERHTARRFPVVYLLTGFAGRGRQMLNHNPFAPNIAERMDALIDEGKSREMILVLPDCLTRLGGSQYINSPAIGDYETHFINELVPFVDANFRTIPYRESRAVAGKSSGGYAALIYAMRHADIFSIAASHSGDALFEYSLLPEFPQALRTINKHGGVENFVNYIWSTERHAKEDIPTLNVIAMAAAYSPDSTQPLNLRLPFDLHTGEIIEHVWHSWLAHDPVRLISHHTDALRSLKLLYLDAGTRDEYALDLAARAISRQLTEANVPHIHEEHDAGHFQTSFRYSRSLALISDYIKHE